MNPTRALHLAALALVSVLLPACDDDEPDAYGNFEAREIVVSAEVAGRLLHFEPAEGQRLEAGALVGRIDTAGLALQRQELLARRRVATTRAGEVDAQIEVLRAQLATAREEHQRALRLYEAEAATAERLERAAGEVRVLERRIDAAGAQARAAREEVGGVDARVDQVAEHIDRTRIVNPVAGTVLTTWVEAGEFAQPGAPLYELARLDTLTLRAYVSGGQLAALRIGDSVEVRIDAAGGELAMRTGWVTWIADEAEFTPTPIQTREERTEQVYAVKIRVPNTDGAIKIGMPGEVVFGRERPGS